MFCAHTIKFPYNNRFILYLHVVRYTHSIIILLKMPHTNILGILKGSALWGEYNTTLNHYSRIIQKT